MRKVTVDEVAGRLSSGEEVTVIDSRSAAAWGGSEIKAGGAVRIPPNEAEQHLADVKRDTFGVVYCT